MESNYCNIGNLTFGVHTHAHTRARACAHTYTHTHTLTHLQRGGRGRGRARVLCERDFPVFKKQQLLNQDCSSVQAHGIIRYYRYRNQYTASSLLLWRPCISRLNPTWSLTVALKPGIWIPVTYLTSTRIRRTTDRCIKVWPSLSVSSVMLSICQPSPETCLAATAPFYSCKGKSAACANDLFSSSFFFFFTTVSTWLTIIFSFTAVQDNTLSLYYYHYCWFYQDGRRDPNQLCRHLFADSWYSGIACWFSSGRRENRLYCTAFFNMRRD